MNKRKLLKKILAGSHNVRFGDLVVLVEAFGFRLARINGSHHLFKRDGIAEGLNLQERDGKAIPYQIRQFLTLIEEYNLSMEKDE